jgi:plasmid maintenance system antidote protein VapI
VQAVIDERYDGTAGRLAEAIGVALTTLSRGMELGTMGADTLLRLAHVTGRDPSDVLRLAGKSDWADLIEALYGPPRPVQRPEIAAVAQALEAWDRAYVEALRVMVATPPPQTRETRDTPAPRAQGTTPPASQTPRSSAAPSATRSTDDAPAARRVRRPK